MTVRVQGQRDVAVGALSTPGSGPPGLSGASVLAQRGVRGACRSALQKLLLFTAVSSTRLFQGLAWGSHTPHAPTIESACQWEPVGCREMRLERACLAALVRRLDGSNRGAANDTPDRVDFLWTPCG